MLKSFIISQCQNKTNKFMTRFIDTKFKNNTNPKMMRNAVLNL